MTSSALATLLWTKARIGRHWIASVKGESRLKVGFVSLSATFLWLFALLLALVVFHGFQRFGNQILGQEANVNLTDLVMERLLSLFSLSVFLLLIVSNVLVSYATIYRSKEVPYLIQAPISTATFFLGRFVECLSFSSWALAFLGSPVLLAYGIIRGASPLYYLAMVFFFVPFVTIPAALGSSISVLLVRVLAGRRRASMIGAGLLALAVGGLFFRSRIAAPDLEGAQNVQAILDLLGRTQSPFLPSHWLAHGLLSASAGDWGSMLFDWLLLVANGLFFLLIATVLADLFFYHGWTNLLSADEGRVAGSVRGPLSFLEPLLRPLPEPTRSLIVKDVRLFWREPTQWSQFLIFFGLMGLYLANIRNEGGMFSAEPWKSWIALLNMSASMLILATLTTRFIFPLISLEGRRFWILGLAPLSLRRLLWQKFWLSVGCTSVITLGLGLLSGLRLRLDSFVLALSLFAIAATTFALSGLAVGLGSLYPNFEEDNPSRITSGMGGTLNFILSLVYIVVVTASQGVLVRWSRLEDAVGTDRSTATVVVILFILALTIVTCWLPMRLGRFNLERAEL